MVERQVEVGGRAVNLVDMGTGRPLLLMHGLGACWQTWLPCIAPLAEHYRVVALDFPGFGASELPDWDVDAARYADFVPELADALAIDEPLTLAGNSLGGLVSCEVAIRHAERVAAIALVCSAGISTADRRRLTLDARLSLVALPRLGSLIAARAQSISESAVLRRLVLGRVFAHVDRVPPTALAAGLSGMGAPGAAPVLRTGIGHEVESRLGGIACPALVLWGAKDRLTPVRDAKVLAQRIPGSRLVVLDDAGHVPQLERPEAVCAELRGFLDEGVWPPPGPQAARTA